MKKSLNWTAICLIALVSACSPSNDQTFDEAKWRAELQEWRDARVPRLKGNRGWATVTGLDWLNEGDNTVGSASGKHVQFDPGSAAPHVGVIRLHDGIVQFEADPSAEVYKDSTRVTAIEMLTDDTGTPTILRTGTVQFSVIRRGPKLGVRTWDSRAESAASLTSIPNYEADPTWVKSAEFIRYKPMRTVDLVTVINIPESNPVDGYIQFEHEGQTYTLDVIAEPGDTELFVIFGDLTNKDDTYGAGRYLYVDRPDTSADRTHVWVDFNKSYNPPCAFTGYATCAYPSDNNKLPIRIEAGEKRMHH